MKSKIIAKKKKVVSIPLKTGTIIDVINSGQTVDIIIAPSDGTENITTHLYHRKRIMPNGNLATVRALMPEEKKRKAHNGDYVRYIPSAEDSTTGVYWDFIGN